MRLHRRHLNIHIHPRQPPQNVHSNGHVSIRSGNRIQNLQGHRDNQRHPINRILRHPPIYIPHRQSLPYPAENRQNYVLHTQTSAPTTHTIPRSRIINGHLSLPRPMPLGIKIGPAPAIPNTPTLHPHPIQPTIPIHLLKPHFKYILNIFHIHLPGAFKR